MSDLEYIPREIEAHVRRLAGMFPCVTVCGPRQSGKTTMARHIFREYDYVSMEDPNNRHMFIENASDFLRQHPAPAIFDEVQNTPELLSHLQVIMDDAGQNGMYILTGSRQMELQRSITQSLAGRTAMVDLLPISLREMEAAGIHLSRDEAIFYGGLPRVIGRGADTRAAYSSYFRTYVERDARQIANLRHLHSFEMFIRLLASRVGQLVNYASLATEVGVSAPTIKEWMSILTASYIVYELKPYFRNIGKRIAKSTKVYFTETGLVTYLLGFSNPEDIDGHPLMGNLFENMMVMEALKSRFNTGNDADLYFFRDAHGLEVDLVWDDRCRPHPIEIKASPHCKDSMVAALRKFGHLYPDAYTPALIYGGDEPCEVAGVPATPFRDAGMTVLRNAPAVQKRGTIQL